MTTDLDPAHSRERRAGLAGLAVVFLFFYGPYLVGYAPSGGDIVNQYLPYQQLIRDAVRSGHWPLWNAMTFCGRPLMGDIQVGVLYPPNWLHWALPAPLALTFAIVLALHGAWMIAGCWLLGRRWGLAPPAIALGTVLWAAGPFFTLKMTQGIVLFIYVGAWWPWLALAVARLVERPGFARMAALAVVILLSLLAGSPQITFYGWIGAAALGIADCGLRIADCGRDERDLKDPKDVHSQLATPNPQSPIPNPQSSIVNSRSAIVNRQSAIRNLGRRLGWLALSFATAAGLSAIQTMQTRDFIADSFARGAGTSWDYVVDGSLTPRLFWLLLNPGFLGTGNDPAYYWGGRMDFAESCDYLPLWVLGVLAPLALVWLARRDGDGDPSERLHRRLGWLALAAMACGVALAPGESSPLFKLFFHVVPGFDRFRVPARLMTIFLAGAALLAALVCDRLWRGKFTARTVGAAALGGPALALAALWGSYAMRQGLWTALGSRFPGADPTVPAGLVDLVDTHALSFAWRVSAFLVAGAAALWAMARPWRNPGGGRSGDRRSRLIAWAPAALALAELGWLALPFRHDTRVAQYDEAFYPRTRLVRLLDEQHRGGRILWLDDTIGWLTDQNQPEVYPNRLVMQALPDARGYDPVNARRLGEWMNLLAGAEPSRNPHGFMFVERIARPLWLPLMGVETVLSYQDLSRVEGLRRVERMRFREGDLTLWRNERFRGMAFAAPDPLIAPPEPPPPWRASLYASAARAEAESTDTLATITIDFESAIAAPPLAVNIDERFRVEPVEEGPNAFRYAVDYPEPALLYLAQSAYDGWTARVDGAPAETFFACGTWLATPVPAGRHEVEFAYEPTSFTIGWTISLATLVALLYGLVRSRIKSNV